jgi:hypothetical protein
VNTAFNHYSLLRSIEKMFKLPYLGFAAQSGLKTFDGAFGRKSCAS